MLQRILLLTYYSVFYHRLVMMYFVVDLLWWVFMSSTINFFMDFCVRNSNDKI